MCAPMSSPLAIASGDLVAAGRYTAMLTDHARRKEALDPRHSQRCPARDVWGGIKGGGDDPC